jgi:hypothetical protein
MSAAGATEQRVAYRQAGALGNVDEQTAALQHGLYRITAVLFFE